MHEEMITSPDSYSTLDLGKYFAILPPDGHLLKKYEEKNIRFAKVIEGSTYNSGNNTDFLTIEEIRNLIKLHVDPEFKPI